jgi:hypothetical protein
MQALRGISPPRGTSPATRDVDVAAGQIGSQALEPGLIDQVVVNPVPWCSAPAPRSSPPAA